MGPITYTKARITSLLDPKNPKYEKCHQANIRAAIGFYETGYETNSFVNERESILCQRPVWIEASVMLNAF